MTSPSERQAAERGFWNGVVICLLVVTAFIAGMAVAKSAHAAQRTAPPQYWIDTALKIGKCEQPSGRPGKWAAVNWKNEKNYSFKGGMGMTLANWHTFKKKGYPEDANDATPMQQITAAWRLYRWAEKTYPGYGYTAWECSEMIGFFGFNPDGTWK